MSIQVQNEAPGTYLPQGGEKNLEVKFTPLGKSPISISGIKYRKFMSPTKAYRISLNPRLYWHSLPQNTDIEISSFSSQLSLSAGIEHHIPTTERLSVYFGYQGSLGGGYLKSSSFYIANEVNYPMKRSSGDFSIGAKGFGGIDYYISRNIYIGTELGYGIKFTKGLDLKIKYSGLINDERIIKGENKLDMSPSYTAQIRLGWLF